MTEVDLVIAEDSAMFATPRSRATIVTTMLSLAAALSLFLSAATLNAQQTVCVTGVVERLAGPTICVQQVSHRLAGTSVYLSSTGANLGRYEGRNCRIEGISIGSTCIVLDVRRVDTTPPATLHLCGSPATSCPIELVLCPGGPGRGVLMMDWQPGYRPLGCATTVSGLDGTLLLGANPLTLWSGALGGCQRLQLQIPVDNSLIGLQLWFQGARMDIGPVGPLQLTNVVEIRVAPFMPPCGSLGC